MNLFLSLGNFLLWIAPVCAMVLAARQLIHFFQLSSYQFGGFLRAFARQPLVFWWPGLAVCISSVVFTFLCSLTLSWPPLLYFVSAVFFSALILLSGQVVSQIAYREKRVKVPLHLTARVKRLYAMLLLLGLLLALLTYLLLPLMGFSALIPALLPLWVLLAAALIWPFEKAVQQVYREDARRILDSFRSSGLKVIGVTGSYGKTTVKNILYALLSQQAPTLASPASFNTPMGLSRCIREELGSEHQFFIAEMGARHRQDIRVLSRFIKPQYGILTAIGPQHLQTLGSLEEVKQTKYELIKRLPEDGFSVFSNDGKLVSACYEQTHIDKAIVGQPGDDLWAEEVDLLPEAKGSRFVIRGKDGLAIACQTSLPGEHNIQNILLAACLALHLGISPKQIEQGIKEVQPPPSRLSIHEHHKGYTVINNGFNSNPDSSRKALQVLAQTPGQRVVVTPGFIELGRGEEEANRALGHDLAHVAHTVLLVGEKHTRPIKEGLLDSGFQPEHILVFASLSEANAYLNEHLGQGDVVLYENDLPDHYR